MWKDFFYFSKGQRIGIVVLILLIAFAIALYFILPHLCTQKTSEDISFLNEVNHFKRSLVSKDSLKKLEWEEKYNYNFPRKTDYKDKKADTYSLFSFDPNKVDSAHFVMLGLKPFIASNILKFRQKGGVFRTKASFAKVYGITPEKYNELEPYIVIPEVADTRKDSIKLANEKYANLRVELNSADTTELMQIKGIGRFYAKAIVRFRQQTGGFVSVNQLHDLYGMTEPIFQKISSFCTVNQLLVQKMKVNIATVEKLKSHPYLNFYQAKAIYELRRKKGKLHNIQELRNIDELTPESLTKIEPYLSFE